MVDSLMVTGDVSIYGTITLGTTLVTGPLYLPSGIVVDEEGVNSITETLYIQKKKLADLDFMDGTLVINTRGDVMVTGNLAVSGNLSVGGVLGVRSIRPLDDELVINLSRDNVSSESGIIANSSLVIKGAGDSTAVTINASGSASFAGNINASGSGIFRHLAIRSDETANTDASPSAQKSIGSATIPAGLTDITIPSLQVSDSSLIYITPISSTNNQVLYIKRKETGKGFTVGMDTPIGTDITFNWWIIQQITE
jgi:hypothetical protein